jgi:NRAMP (natural resistance-associated macrophage protein)-like metal ion transporter
MSPVRKAVDQTRQAVRWASGVPGAIARFWRALGPGLISGAADDDPSGIATYSIAGAQFGTSLLWTAPVTCPLMASVQTMCARVGMVTGMGLAGALRQKFPRPLVAAACLALLVANTINIGADLSGMADAAELLTGVDSHLWVAVYGGLIAWATIRLQYAAFSRVLKWLALILVAYILAAFYVGPDWSDVLRHTVVPRLSGDRSMWATLVAILGTTVSPYLFFWQASSEVEEDKAKGRLRLIERQGATLEEINWRKMDIGVGTFFSNIAMFFIILTTALTLHPAGLTHLSTSQEVAQALEPLAGRSAALLYLIGLLGTGALAIPTLAGSAAYALSETFGWREGINEPFRHAPEFYGVVILSVAIGITFDWVNLNPVQALYWTAVINGLLAPFLLVGILMVASDRKLMQGQASSRLGRVTVGITTAVMFAAGVAMFVL